MLLPLRPQTILLLLFLCYYPPMYFTQIIYPTHKEITLLYISLESNVQTGEGICHDQQLNTMDVTFVVASVTYNLTTSLPFQQSKVQIIYGSAFTIDRQNNFVFLCYFAIFNTTIIRQLS